MIWEEFEQKFGDAGIRIGPIGIGVAGAYKLVKCKRTEDSEAIRLDLNPAVKKEQIKVRLVEPGILEIEWPRIKTQGQDIPVE